MKVLNLQCSGLHLFEGWFASEEDFQAQKARALVQCPLCGVAAVHKMPSAPRLNLKASKNPVGKNRLASVGAENSTSDQRPADSYEEAHEASIASSNAAPSLQPSASQTPTGGINGQTSTGLSASPKPVDSDQALRPHPQDQPLEVRQKLLLRALREMVRKSEDVGDRFADEARRMHYEGGKSVRSIRGQTSQSEAIALLEEGINILPLPPVAGLTETLQ